MRPAFDFGGFLRFVRGWLYHLPWTGRRALVTAAFFLFYPPFALATAAALSLDRLLFPGHRHRPVVAPVFIIGNFRSGTTYLHRLLVQDRDNFHSMTMWEILFAPSVTQRRLVAALRRLDRQLGGPVRRLAGRLERHWQRHNDMHRVSLSEPEEDEYLLLHTFSALTIGLSSGLLEQARPYAWFDGALPEPERRRIMGFYRRCIQRHLHAHRVATGVHYLAKNPALCPKLASLLAEFPDARIIYLVRSPLDTVPSFTSMMRFSWRTVGVRVDERALEAFLVEMIGHWYRYPLAELDARPHGNHAIVRYDDLVADPDRTVQTAYRSLGLPISSSFRRVLAREAAAGRRASGHSYSLADLDLEREDMVRAFGDVLQRFRFPSGDVETG